jgi:hypothetical protein
VTRRAPIPLQAFKHLTDSLNRQQLSAFLESLYLRSGESITVVEPSAPSHPEEAETKRLFVHTDISRLTQLASEGDVVFCPDAAVDQDEIETHIIREDDLRNRLLFGMEPETANTIAEQFFAQPVWAEQYRQDDQDEPAGKTEKQQQSQTTLDATRLVEKQPFEKKDIQSLMIVGVVVMLGVTAGSMGLSGEDPSFEEISSPNVTNATQSAQSAAEDEAIPNDDIDEPLAANGIELYADRNVRPRPNCQRSFLHVVQIQVNAMKHNNNNTNDGLWVVRQFATPRNREAIDSFSRFVSIVKSEPYAPLLRHTSAEFEPDQYTDNFAEVTVTTRRNGSVTGEYEFQMQKISQEPYEGCWMTGGVGVNPIVEPSRARSNTTSNTTS